MIYALRTWPAGAVSVEGSDRADDGKGRNSRIRLKLERRARKIA